jgi:hypothetical protein
MAFPVGLAIAGGASLLGGLFGGRSPQFEGLSAAEINRLIDAYRQQGLEGIRTQGQRAQAGASARLAASGLEPSLALQQSLYNPILEQLSGARAQLESGLAATAGDLTLKSKMAEAQANFGAQMQSQQNILGLLSGIGDVGGLLALQGGLGGGNTNPLGNSSVNIGYQPTIGGNPYFVPPYGLRGFNPGDAIG